MSYGGCGKNGVSRAFPRSAAQITARFVVLMAGLAPVAAVANSPAFVSQAVATPATAFVRQSEDIPLRTPGPQREDQITVTAPAPVSAPVSSTAPQSEANVPRILEFEIDDSRMLLPHARLTVPGDYRQ